MLIKLILYFQSQSIKMIYEIHHKNLQIVDERKNQLWRSETKESPRLSLKLVNNKLSASTLSENAKGHWIFSKDLFFWHKNLKKSKIFLQIYVDFLIKKICHYICYYSENNLYNNLVFKIIIKLEWDLLSRNHLSWSHWFHWAIQLMVQTYRPTKAGTKFTKLWI